MLMNEYTPKITIFSTPEKADKFVAQQIVKEFAGKKRVVCTIATGLTTQSMMPFLLEAYKHEEIDFTNVIFFGLDEYWKIPQNHPFSTAKRLEEQLFSYVNIKKENIHFPNGNAVSAQKESGRIEKLLLHYNGLDLAVVGIGPGKTCHIGLNEVGSEIDSPVRYMPYDKESRAALMKKISLSSTDIIPDGGITLGMKVIMNAKKIILVAKGDNKAWGIQRSLKGPISKEAPASFLRYHPHVQIILDEKAGGML